MNTRGERKNGICFVADDGFGRPCISLALGAPRDARREKTLKRPKGMSRERRRRILENSNEDNDIISSAAEGKGEERKRTLTIQSTSNSEHSHNSFFSVEVNSVRVNLLLWRGDGKWLSNLGITSAIAASKRSPFSRMSTVCKCSVACSLRPQ